MRVVAVVVEIVALLAVAVWWNHPIGWIVAFVLIGRAFVECAILAHEAAHGMLFANRRLNDVAGASLSHAVFIPFGIYRGAHLRHHGVSGPREGDDIERVAVALRRVVQPGAKPALGTAGSDEGDVRAPYGRFTALLRVVVGSRAARSAAVDLVVLHVPLAAAMWWLSGRWWLHLVLWVAPWATVWQALTWLRAVAEHGDLVDPTGERSTTHHVRQTRSARFWLVPFNAGWHLAHHVDFGVPFSNLPALHAELGCVRAPVAMAELPLAVAGLPAGCRRGMSSPATPTAAEPSMPCGRHPIRRCNDPTPGAVGHLA